MLNATSRVLRRLTPLALATGLLLALVLVPAGAGAHPDPTGKGHGQEGPGLGVQVNSPSELAGFFEAVQWAGTAPVENQTQDLVYAGTGCTPANYVPIADRIEGKIALVDSKVNPNNPADQCPRYTFFQKVRSAQHAGAIGFVQIPAEGEDPRGNATAIAADIPALEVHRTDATLEVRDAVIAGTAVNVTLTPAPPPPVLERLSDVPCEGGMAGPFPCEGVDLLSFMPRDEFDAPEGAISDLWGWTDPETGDEYVIMGKLDGTAFFRVTDPFDPVYLGELPNPGLLQGVWHDMKVYADHAFIVSESDHHGMGVFDLTRLRGVEEPQMFDRDAEYPLHSSAHNIAINEETGFAYVVGGNMGIVAPDQCLSGLHMINIQNPKNPTFAGCYLMDGGPGTLGRTVGGPVEENSPAAYVHDTQCVIYEGPDTRYTGRELCFNASEDQVTIADVTNKLLPTTVGTVTYENVAYAHQGWLSEDQRYLFVNDELDEEGEGEGEPDINTRTIVLDVSDLENPKVHFEHFHETISPDHNNYVHQGLLYQSNYSSGLRVLDTAFVDDTEDPRLEQVAFFDTYPAAEDTFDGTWSNYPFFESGTIAVSGRNEGLFLLRLQEGISSQPAVEIACKNCPIQTRAGQQRVARMTVSNVGQVDDVYDLSVSGLPEGWTARVRPAELAVPAGEDGVTTVRFRVPEGTAPGTYDFVVTATSTVDPSVSASEVVEVIVREGQPSGVGEA